jgi:hypothetical protein
MYEAWNQIALLQNLLHKVQYYIALDPSTSDVITVVRAVIVNEGVPTFA